jgi:hypothetical protein
MEGLLKMPEIQPGDDLDEIMGDLIRRGLKTAWRRGFESGVVTDKAAAQGEPLPPAVDEYLNGLAEDEEEVTEDPR